MKLKIERRRIQDLNQEVIAANPQRVVRDTNTLSSRTLARLPGEVFA
jgi:hypothetical protein